MEKDLIAIDEIAGELLSWYDASNRERVASGAKPGLQSLYS